MRTYTKEELDRLDRMVEELDPHFIGSGAELYELARRLYEIAAGS